MSNQVPTEMVDTFTTGIAILAQQTKFVLAGAVREESETGNRVAFDQVGVVSARARTSRHADTPRIDVPHRKRWVNMTDFEVSDLLDWSDLLKVLNNPGGAYAQAMVAALNRSKDASLISAMLGTAQTAQDGLTAVILPAGQQIAVGGTGFTLAKLQSAATLLFGKAVYNPDDAELHIAWTRAQEDAFLSITQVQNVDYNTQKVLVAGTMGDSTFYGFKYHRLEDFVDDLGATVRLIPKVSTTRSCVAWVKSGVCHNAPLMPTIRVDERPDKSFSWQFYASASHGSTRLQEEKVVQIDVLEP